MTELRIPPLAEGQVPTKDDVQLNQTDYVAAGDITAAVDVIKLLTDHRRSLELRSGPNLPFVDLHKRLGITAFRF